MRVGFWGANNTVTGSRTVIETNDARILVDCGLFHGDRGARAHNRAPFPVEDHEAGPARPPGVHERGPVGEGEVSGRPFGGHGAGD